MGYIGNQQTEGFSSIPAKQDLTGATGGTLTLTHAVSSPEAIDLYINHVRQKPTSSYSIVGTTVTLNGYTVAATDDIYVVYNSLALQTTVTPDASVSTAKLIDGSVSTAKIIDGNVTSAKLAATIAPTNLETTASTFKMTDLSSNAFYRTGSFTPVWSSTGATDVTQSITTGTYGNQVGQYIRIGDLVNFSGLIQSPPTWTYTNGGATGQSVYIYGLPFKGASSNLGNEQWGVSINYHSALSWAQSLTITGMVRNNEKFIRLFYFGDSTSGNVDTSHVGLANSFIYFSGSYRTEEA
jgi:hypothetical protein